MVSESSNKYNYFLTVVVGTVVGLILTGFFVIQPLYNTATKVAAEKKTKEATLSEMKARLEVLNKLSDQEEKLKADSQTVSNSLPTQEDIGRLFIQLDSIAKQSGGNLKSVSQITGQSVDASGAGFTEQSYSIPLEMSSYFALKQFITNASDALRLLSISDLKIDANDAGALTVNMTAKSYVRTK